MQIPRATYRFQFNGHFRLEDALDLVPYLRDLGISHIYASPLFKACAHSNHGYDVCDFGQINPEVGTEADLANLVAALRKNQMGLILDIVPNHMGVGTAENSWWWDVLKNGRASRFASHFDINWEPPDETLCGKILLPVLGDTCELALQKGELKIAEENDGYVLRYYENRFPLAPDSVPKTFVPEEINAQLPVLEELIRRQHYRLANWRDGDRQLNYRRFFAISTLAGLRVEAESVFVMVHPLLRRWIEKGWVDGIRVDHPDGLREPENYLRRLRALAPDQWIVVEKILQPQEDLPRQWPVQGTTGYDFLNQVNGLFVNSVNETALTDFYIEFTGEPPDAALLAHEEKRLVLESLFATEVSRLAGLLSSILIRRFPEKDFPREQQREVLLEFVASFPVYRTYVSVEKKSAGENDLHFIRQAAAAARATNPDLPAALFDLLSGLLCRHFPGGQENDFIARFQQLTGAVMAKGVEDTVCYCFNRFASLNEVGGNPGKFGVSADEFHAFCRRQQAHWPHTMLASSTHDTKRGEDVRARLNVLSEIPEAWRAAVLRWSEMNDRYHSHHFPDRNAEYLFYQTLVGAWPVSVERISAYMEKASCEAKQQTDWNDRNIEYDAALKKFIVAVLADRHFSADLESFVARLVGPAQVNSLAQTLLKLTAPGVPDIYQGNELPDFSLVDPDNRRPVDYQRRQRLLAASRNLAGREIWERRDDALPKIWLIQNTLALRAKYPDIFEGSYEPLGAQGERANHVIAFIRGGGVITIVPRFVLELKGDWADTTLELPAGVWHHEFTGETFAGNLVAGELFKNFPVALLVKTEQK
jgi:(1->4)-alpha-D-glucan 1-alpha-D-glucosylmutase